MSSEIGSRIAKNSIFNVIRTFLTVPITLLITPYIIRHLGKEEFGVWALVGVVSSYAQLSDFGITESLIKFVAEYKERNEPQKLNQLINTAFSVYLVLSCVCFWIFVAALPFIITKVLNIPPALQGEATYIFEIAILLFFVNMLMGVFGSLIVGFQRMGYSNVVSTLSIVIMACGTFLFIYKGYGLTGLIYNNAIVTLFVVISNIFIAKHLFPDMRINPILYFDKEMLKKIFSFSWKVQVSNITQLMIFQLDRVLLSHFIGLTAVSNYEIANRIASQARAFIASIFAPMVPAASALQAKDEKEKVTGLYRKSFKYMSIAAIPFSFLIIALAQPFVRIWIGLNYETSALTMQLLMLAYMLNLLTGPGSFILSGISKPQVGMITSVIAGVTNLVLCLWLVQWIGYYGIIVGIFISILISGIYFIRMVHKNIEGLSYLIYKRCLFKPLVVSLGVASLVILLGTTFHINGPFSLCFTAMLYVAIVVLLITRGNYLDEFDRRILANLNPLRFVRQ